MQDKVAHHFWANEIGVTRSVIGKCLRKKYMGLCSLESKWVRKTLPRFTITDLVYDEKDSKKRHLEPRVIGDPHENKFGPTFVTAV